MRYEMERERDRETMDTMDEWKGVKWIEIKTERERERLIR